MYDDSFAKGIRRLEIAYSLDTKDLALILNIEEPAYISFWKNSTHIPTYKQFDDIITLFAVSPAWLSGFRCNPYEEFIIGDCEKRILESRLEEEWKQFFFKLNLFPQIDTSVELIDDYLDEVKRKQKFSLSTRADIVFLLNVLLAFDEAMDDDISVESMRFCKCLKEVDVYSKIQKRQAEYVMYLHGLLTGMVNAVFRLDEYT